MKRAAVVLAEGFEEIEALTPVDLLRRAGVGVSVVGLTSPQITGARGIRVTADMLLEEFDGKTDLLILPGGMPGSRNLAQSARLRELIAIRIKNNEYVAAICAAPALVLGEAGFLQGRKFTCYPGMESHVPGGVYTSRAVESDGPLITSRGVGTAAAFSLALIELLLGPGVKEEVKEKCLL